MKYWESIKDMFTRFNDIVPSLETLEKNLLEWGEDQKNSYRSLFKEWDPKVRAIQEAKDLEILFFDYLIGSLVTHHEIMMKRKDSEELKKNCMSLTFKVPQSSIEEIESDENDNIIILTRKFKKFIRGKKLVERLKPKGEEVDMVLNFVSLFSSMNLLC